MSATRALESDNLPGLQPAQSRAGELEKCTAGFGASDSLAELAKRIDRLDRNMSEMKLALARLEPVVIRMDVSMAATIPYLARTADLIDKPDKAYLWGILGVLAAAIVAGTGVAALVMTLVQ
jgi:hypothetical protein